MKRLDGSGTVPEVSTSEYRLRRSRSTAVYAAVADEVEEEGWEVAGGGWGEERSG